MDGAAPPPFDLTAATEAALRGLLTEVMRGHTFGMVLHIDLWRAVNQADAVVVALNERDGTAP